MILILLVFLFHRALYFHRILLATVLSTPFSAGDDELANALRLELHVMEYYRINHPLSVFAQYIVFVLLVVAGACVCNRPKIKR